MDRVILSSILGLSMAIVIPAEAQQAVSPDVETETARSPVVITTAPSQGYDGSNQGYFQHELQDANRGIRNTRNALLAAGGTIFGLATIGMITSGIMLGVRKGSRRRLERDIRNRQYGTRLQWDVPSGSLVF